MDIFIGKLIKEVTEKRGISKSELGRRLNMSSTNVHKIFKRESIDTDLLSRIGAELEYDFFLHYIRDKSLLASVKSYSIPVEMGAVAEPEGQYKKELKQCKEKVSMLEKINSLLEEKLEAKKAKK